MIVMIMIEDGTKMTDTVVIKVVMIATKVVMTMTNSQSLNVIMTMITMIMKVIAIPVTKMSVVIKDHGVIVTAVVKMNGNRLLNARKRRDQDHDETDLQTQY